MDISGFTKKSNSIVSAKDLAFVVRIFKKNWWILLVLPALAYVLGHFYTYRLHIVHQVSTEI